MPAVIKGSSTPLLERDEWETPDLLFENLQKLLQIQFQLDPCATEKNTKCRYYFDKEMDGLLLSWRRFDTVFVNPPYSRGSVEKWLRKALRSVLPLPDKMTIAVLIPADTSTEYWRDLVADKAAMVLFLTPRVRFVGSSGTPNFASAVVVYGALLAPEFGVPRPGVYMWQWKENLVAPLIAATA